MPPQAQDYMKNPHTHSLYKQFQNRYARTTLLDGNAFTRKYYARACPHTALLYHKLTRGRPSMHEKVIIKIEKQCALREWICMLAF